MSQQKTWSSIIKQRQKGRRMALQSLYEIDTVTHKPGVVIDERIRYEQPDEHGRKFLHWLIAGILRYQEQIDGYIAKLAPNWPVNKLAVIDRNILRIALYELGSQESETPSKVIINEAIELAKRFGSDSSSRFVNGVLGSALHELEGNPFNHE